MANEPSKGGQQGGQHDQGKGGQQGGQQGGQHDQGKGGQQGGQHDQGKGGQQPINDPKKQQQHEGPKKP